MINDAQLKVNYYESVDIVLDYIGHLAYNYLGK